MTVRINEKNVMCGAHSKTVDDRSRISFPFAGYFQLHGKARSEFAKDVLGIIDAAVLADDEFQVNNLGYCFIKVADGSLNAASLCTGMISCTVAIGSLH